VTARFLSRHVSILLVKLSPNVGVVSETVETRKGTV